VGADPRRARDPRHVGRAGEELAARYLERRGYRIVGRGFLARRGEIDLVCQRGGRLVLVEVKARSGERYGSPAEAVNARKRRALVAAAAEYRALAGWKGPIDFAVVSIASGAEPELIEHPF
jgi:putative endonuclease